MKNIVLCFATAFSINQTKKWLEHFILPITTMAALHRAMLPMIRVKQELSNAGIYLGQRLGT